MHRLNYYANLSKSFTREEFLCKCGDCGFCLVDAELVSVLQDVRDMFEMPVTITSACRCDKHNKAVGGADNSAHLYGMAADIQVKNVSPKDVADYLREKYSGFHSGCYGIGEYETFVHIDVRKDMARW